MEPTAIHPLLAAAFQRSDTLAHMTRKATVKNRAREPISCGGAPLERAGFRRVRAPEAASLCAKGQAEHPPREGGPMEISTSHDVREEH